MPAGKKPIAHNFQPLVGWSHELLEKDFKLSQISYYDPNGLRTMRKMGYNLDLCEILTWTRAVKFHCSPLCQREELQLLQ